MMKFVSATPVHQQTNKKKTKKNQKPVPLEVLGTGAANVWHWAGLLFIQHNKIKVGLLLIRPISRSIGWPNTLGGFIIN